LKFHVSRNTLLSSLVAPETVFPTDLFLSQIIDHLSFNSVKFLSKHNLQPRPMKLNEVKGLPIHPHQWIISCLLRWVLVTINTGRILLLQQQERAGMLLLLIQFPLFAEVFILNINGSLLLIGWVGWSW